MPELPEVETTLRGLEPHLVGQRIVQVIVREPRLRQPIPASGADWLSGQRIHELTRRGKYLLARLDQGTLILHLGMSGSLRLTTPATPVRRHDHVECVLANGTSLRLHDPRRFGLFLTAPETPDQVCAGHPLLCRLGVEPLTPDFDGAMLHAQAQRRRSAVKAFIMDANVVVGVGNIYASESLFLAGIHPARSCARISRQRYARLAESIREVLAAAIAAGGTTLRDFVAEDGQPGYFAQWLRVYGRQGQPCRTCGQPLRALRIAQRSSFFCPRCQR